MDTCGTSMGFDRFRIDRAGGETSVGFVGDSSRYMNIYYIYIYTHICIHIIDIHICISCGGGIHIGVSKCVAKIASSRDSYKKKSVLFQVV